MTSRGRVVLVVGLVLLGLGEFCWVWYQVMTQVTTSIDEQFAHVAAEQAKETSPQLPPGNARRFSDEELKAFLARARSAEDIADPLQRCLKYPNPPDSHWSPAAVDAYCHFRFQSVMTFDEIEQLIRSGHADDLDRRMEQALQAQLAQPSSRELLDHIFYKNFAKNTFDAREVLDAWKRASPSSAFALAASGYAYVEMAHKARGDATVDKTPWSNVMSMDRLLQLADTDLQRAIQLNPKITPAYEAMMDAGSMSLGRVYIDKAFNQGVAVAPDDYALYNSYMKASQPKWGGSLQAMKSIADRAQHHANTNPMLEMLLADEPSYQFNACDCVLYSNSYNWDAFPVVFDHVSNVDLLYDAGYAAAEHDYPALAVVYLSEALRFFPDENMGHIRRGFALTDVGDTDWALVAGEREINEEPLSAWGYSMRGYAYKEKHNPFLAEPDLKKADALEPLNPFPLTQLGWMYETMAQWDKSWDVASKLIQERPDDAEGWLLRYNIQKKQPRPGMDDTMHYFLDHFGSNPDYADEVSEMRAALAAESTRATTPARPAQSP